MPIKSHRIYTAYSLYFQEETPVPSLQHNKRLRRGSYFSFDYFLGQHLQIGT